MSDPRDLRTAEADPPTRMLPLVHSAGSRHRAPDDGRRLMWATVAGAAVVVLIAMLVLAFAGDDDPVPTAAPTVAATESAAGPGEEPVVPEVSPTPTPSPSPSSPRPRRTAGPAELLAGLQSTLDGLVQQRQLRPGDGKDLRKQLREVGAKIADGDLGEARNKLSEFARKVADLRRAGKLSASGYEVLMGGATQLAQALPVR